MADFDKLKAAGAEVVACVSVNDPFVMDAVSVCVRAGGLVGWLLLFLLLLLLDAGCCSLPGPALHRRPGLTLSPSRRPCVPPQWGKAQGADGKVLMLADTRVSSPGRPSAAGQCGFSRLLVHLPLPAPDLPPASLLPSPTLPPRRPSSPRRWASSWTLPPCWATRAAAGAGGVPAPPLTHSPAPGRARLVACRPCLRLSASDNACCPLCAPPAARSFSAVVEGGALKALNLEEGGGMTCSLSSQILDQLKA